jgi:hypothetical protein
MVERVASREDATIHQSAPGLKKNLTLMVAPVKVWDNGNRPAYDGGLSPARTAGTYFKTQDL